MQKKIKKLLAVPFMREVSGVAFILVGLAGIVLPILPGWILIFYGIELLGLGFLLPVFVIKFMRRVERGVGMHKKQ